MSALNCSYRRTKWIKNCGDPTLSSLGDRQLRHKRVCAAHFPKTAFVNSEYRNALNDKAIPMPFVKVEASESQTSESPAKSTQDEPKATPRQRGRPRKSSISATTSDNAEEDPAETPKEVEDKRKVPAAGSRSRRSAVKQSEEKESSEPGPAAVAESSKPSKETVESEEEDVAPTPRRGNRGRPKRVVTKEVSEETEESIASIFSRNRKRSVSTKADELTPSKAKSARKVDKEKASTEDTDMDVESEKSAENLEKHLAKSKNDTTDIPKEETVVRRGRRRQNVDEPADPKVSEKGNEEVSKPKALEVDKVIGVVKSKQSSPAPKIKAVVVKAEPQSVTKVMDQMKQKAAAVVANSMRKVVVITNAAEKKAGKQGQLRKVFFSRIVIYFINFCTICVSIEFNFNQDFNSNLFHFYERVGYG